MTEETATPIGKSLIAKLCKVMAAIGKIEKKGHNQKHNYDYVKEGDLTEAVSSALAEAGVMMIPTVLIHDLTAVGKSQKGATCWSCIIEIECRWTDGESEFRNMFAGHALDYGDKAYWKAYTNTLKYAVMKTLMVATGDDPEQDNPEVHQRAPEQQTEVQSAPQRGHGANPRSAGAASNQGNNGDFITNPQMSKIWAISKGLDLASATVHEVAGQVSNVTRVPSLKGMTKREASTLIDWLEDLENNRRELSFTEEGVARISEPVKE